MSTHPEDPGRRNEDDDEAREPGVPPHQPPLADGEDEQERVDEEAEQSFPSSDPPAQGGPGI